MAYTTHGHHIPGTFVDAQKPAQPVARCGGPGMCQPCSLQTLRVTHYGLKESRVQIDPFEQTEPVIYKQPDNPLDGATPQTKARLIVASYIRTMLDKSDPYVKLDDDDVYVVWFCKTLQNWKALVSTTLPDGMYYEVTYDGDKRATYLDAYKKFHNVAIPD